MPFNLLARKPKDAWFKDGLRFECRRCGKCCTGGPGFVWMAEEDIVRMAAFLGEDVKSFRDKYLRRSGSLYSLIEKPNYDCIMLTAEGCRVYEVRPAQCRTFPFWKDLLRSPKVWEKNRYACPGVGSGRHFTCEEIQERLDAMAHLE